TRASTPEPVLAPPPCGTPVARCTRCTTSAYLADRSTRADRAGDYAMMHLSSSRTIASARRGRPPVPMEPGFVSGLLSRISRVPDRLLHNGRRRAALAALAGAERAPTSVLVICNGNIFRSPFAAAMLRRVLELRGLGRVR